MAGKKYGNQNALQKLWNKLPPYARNRYYLTLVAFCGIMLFGSSKDLITQFDLRAGVNRLEAKRTELAEKIEAAEAERLDMEVNRERFARETYFMQRNNEDVFIIVPESEEE